MRDNAVLLTRSNDTRGRPPWSGTALPQGCILIRNSRSVHEAHNVISNSLLMFVFSLLTLFDKIASNN